MSVFSLLYRFPFRSCSVVQDDGLVCGHGADSNNVLSDHSTRSITLYVHDHFSVSSQPIPTAIYRSELFMNFPCTNAADFWLS